MANYPKITTHTKFICIIGHPIEHSLSPLMHNTLFQDLKLDYIYLPFDVHPNNLKAAFEGLRALNFKGINITIPYKEISLRYMDEIDPLVTKIGALNTVKNENGKLLGKNTDALGAKKALNDANFNLKKKKVVILGAGGAARAICFTIKDEIDELIVVNRTFERAKILRDELQKDTFSVIKAVEFELDSINDLIQSADLLINTTPIGMNPNIDISPIPKEFLHENLNVFDIIYNPLRTQLLKDASDIGCKTLGGLDMLVNQGALAFKWWTSKTPNIRLMKDKVVEFLEVKNVR